MTATVSFLPSAPHAAPRPASHAATAADAGGDAEGTGSPLDGGAATGAARPFSAWMREQQQQQQGQERRRLAGSGAPGASTSGPGVSRGGKAPGVAADTDTAGSTTSPDVGSGRGVSTALVDPIVCEAPAGGLAALLGVPPQPGEDAASARADDTLGGGTARDRIGGFSVPGGAAGVNDRAAGRSDGLAGDVLRRAAGGTDAAAAASPAAADGNRADALPPSDAARRTADAGGERGPGDVGRSGTSRGTSVGPRSDTAATPFVATLDAARLSDGGRDAPVGPTAAPTPGGTPAALGTAVAFVGNGPAEPMRTDPVASGALVLDLAAPVDAADFAPALGAQVAVLARDGVQRAELNLHPADMGPVSIDISIVGTTAHVDFGADVAATRAAIESGLADLAAALHEAGFTLAGGGVSSRARGRDGGEAGRLADDGGRRVTAGGSRHGPDAADGGDSGRVTRRTVQLRQGAVDLYA